MAVQFWISFLDSWIPLRTSYICGVFNCPKHLDIHVSFSFPYRGGADAKGPLLILLFSHRCDTCGHIFIPTCRYLYPTVTIFKLWFNSKVPSKWCLNKKLISVLGVQTILQEKASFENLALHRFSWGCLLNFAYISINYVLSQVACNCSFVRGKEQLRPFWFTSLLILTKNSFIWNSSLRKSIW